MTGGRNTEPEPLKLALPRQAEKRKKDVREHHDQPDEALIEELIPVEVHH
jgi:hypothetical protein